jgi:uncharacterized membrane protein
MKFKHIPKYLLIFLLTLGASVTLGLLSFGGAYLFIPLISLGIAAFTLSVAYEAEIYWQNLNGAMDKLLKRDYLKNLMGRNFLLDLAHDNDCQFLRDYKAQLRLVNAYQNKRLDKESQKRKKQAEKTLRAMEKWFTNIAFSDKASYQSQYEQEIKHIIDKNNGDIIKKRFKKHKAYYHIAKAVCIAIGVFTSLGTLYLFFDIIAALSLVSIISGPALPFILIPAAIIAGAAYGLMIYNTITNMLANDTLNKWYQKIKSDIKKGGAKSIFIATAAVLLISLSIALTICTAGTWWQIAKETTPLFSWVRKIPAFVTGVLTPLFTGIGALFFNIENTTESLGFVEQLTEVKQSPWASFKQNLSQGFKNLLKNENKVQLINPFRLLVTLISLPLRLILFIGHILSIGVNADKVPGIPKVVSALLGVISEGFEDLHYFFGHEEHHHHLSMNDMIKERREGEHGHDHREDIPTKLIKLTLSPLYFLAALWDYGFSQFNDKPLTFKRAVERQTGLSKVKRVEEKASLSNDWHKVNATQQINKFNTKNSSHYINKHLGQDKQQRLSKIKEEIASSDNVVVTLASARKMHYATLNTNRNRMFKAKVTKTAQLFNEVEQQVGISR